MKIGIALAVIHKILSEKSKRTVISGKKTPLWPETKGFSILKMPVLSEFICSFKTISVKLPTFFKIDRLKLNLYEKAKGQE